MKTDYAAEIVAFIDNMRIKKSFCGFDRLDTYNQMQELGRRFSAMLEEELQEKEQIISQMSQQLSDSLSRQTRTDAALAVAEQEAKWIIDATNSFVNVERQRAQRIFQDTLKQQQQAVRELEAHKKELRAEIQKMELTIRDLKLCFATMAGQLEQYRTVARPDDKNSIQ